MSFLEAKPSKASRPQLVEYAEPKSAIKVLVQLGQKHGFFSDVEAEGAGEPVFVRLRQSEDGLLLKETLALKDGGLAVLSQCTYRPQKPIDDSLDASRFDEEIKELSSRSPMCQFNCRFGIADHKSIFAESERLFAQLSQPEYREMTRKLNLPNYEIPDPTKLRLDR